MDNKCNNRSRSQINDKLKSKSGWLYKKNPGILKPYKNNFIVLDNKILSMYSDDHKNQLCALINFDQISVLAGIESTDPKKLKICLKDNQILFLFKGSSKEDIQEWEIHIQSHIKASAGSKTILNNFKLTEKFWKFRYITESMFSTQVQTGDIILFKGNSTICSALRGITNCEFDHIGVLYLLNDDLYVFESIRKVGVSLLSWKEFIANQWNRLYQRVGYRKLNIERNQQFYQMADTFVRENIGKPYKLIKIKSGSNTGYFCSELVAEFYKKTGILYLKKPASSFLPKNFTNDGLNIIQGDLGPLYDIKFF
jgi:Permuted papain-like amidase enzyme, YaeF/YiiX, C92 family/PH domain